MSNATTPGRSTPLRTAADLDPRKTGRRTSICCECGAIREVSARHQPRGDFTGEAVDPAHARNMSRAVPAAREYWEMAAERAASRPSARCLEVLKCANCGRTTDHAYLTGSDYAEGLTGGAECCCPTCLRARNEPSAAESAEIRYLESLYSQLGIEVFYRADAITGGGRPAPWAIVRDRTGAIDQWSVEISPDATPQGRLRALRESLGVIAISKEHRMVQPGERGGFVYFGATGDLAGSD